MTIVSLSDGSLERPGVHSPLSPIRERKIDMVVVYKVDRLTQPLADFDMLVELIEAHGIVYAVRVGSRRGAYPGQVCRLTAQWHVDGRQMRRFCLTTPIYDG